MIGGGGGILKVAKSNYVMAFTTISQFGITENNKFFSSKSHVTDYL